MLHLHPDILEFQANTKNPLKEERTLSSIDRKKIGCPISLELDYVGIKGKMDETLFLTRRI